MKHGAFIIGCSDCNEEVCAASGRISTQSGTALEIFERSHDREKNRNLINKLLSQVIHRQLNTFSLILLLKM
jgi:hypothetical protein